LIASVDIGHHQDRKLTKTAIIVRQLTAVFSQDVDFVESTVSIPSDLDCGSARDVVLPPGNPAVIEVDFLVVVESRQKLNQVAFFHCLSCVIHAAKNGEQETEPTPRQTDGVSIRKAAPIPEGIRRPPIECSS